MNDLTLETTLVGNAAPLNAALQSSAQGVKAYGDAAEKAALGAAAASRQNTDAVTAMTAAIAKAKAGGDAYAKTAEGVRDNTRQTAAAMRMLPAQMTDVATQLAGGANPLLVLLQQGGQVKDSFGGLGPMFRGLSAAISPAAVAFGGLAAVGGSVAVAYAKGAAEADAYTRAIVMSGNASGVTRNRLADMARSMDDMAGVTQGAAADALAQVAATGQVAAKNVGLVATTALEVQRTTGVAVKDTVAQFAELGREPVAASKRLNEQYNYLTVAVYEQIKALEKRGEVEAAADLAQRTLANALRQRMAELEVQLGTIERGWRSVKEFAAEAWDAMLGIGRQKTPQQALEEVRERMARLRGMNDGSIAKRLPDLFTSNDERSAELERLAETERLLQRGTAAQEGAAAAKAKDAAATSEWIAGESKREAAAKAAADAWKQYQQDMQRRLALTSEELRLGRELTEVERLELEIRLQQPEQLKKIGKGHEDSASALAQNVIEQERMRASQREAAKAQEQWANAQRQAGIDAYREVASIEQGNEALRQQIDALGLTRVEVAALEAARLGHLVALKEETLQEMEHTGVTGAQTEAIRAQIAKLKERQALVGTLAVRQDEEAYLDSLRKRAEADRQADEQRRDGIAMSISEGIAGGTLSAKKLWDLFRAELAREFARTVLKPQIRPMVDAADSWIKGLISGIGTWMNGGFGTGSAFGNQDYGQFFHGGGVVGVDRPAFARRMPSALWAGAPRFHSGMLAADEFPAVLQKGESVLTPAQMRALGGNQVVQNITYNVPDGYTPAMFATALQQNNQALKGEIAGDMARPGRLMNRAARLSRF